MTRALILVAIAALAVVSACGDSSQPRTSQLSLSATTRPLGSRLAAGAPLPAASSDTLFDGENTLIVTRAEVVLKEVELETIDSPDCDEDSSGCDEFTSGPILLDLPLDGGTEQVVAIAVTPGSYDEVEFDIHKVSGDDPAEAVFRQAHPQMENASIRVEGTFNGEAFTFVTDLDEEQERELSPPLVIADDSDPANVTLRFDMSRWFRDSSGTLIDPRTATTGEPNESMVEENIKNSIKAFEDDDHDGEED
jgi:hypothetical protein